jgi:diguanylate cyclase (GGDEF)-like protein/PAS domain S-box-containing protein
VPVVADGGDAERRGDLFPGLANQPPRLAETLVRAVDQAFDGVMITDVQLDPPGPTIVYVNSALSEITGYGADELVGANPRILQGPKTDRALLDRMRHELERNGTFQGRATNYRRDGSEFEMEWSISTVRGDAGEPRFYVAVQRDATTFRRLLDDAEHRAGTDELTGLINRRVFDAQLALLLADPGTGDRVGLIAVDLDRFKAVNDTHGHAAGDDVLREVARRLRETVRDDDLVARTGGEELTVIMTDVLGPAGVTALAERLREALARDPVPTNGILVPITASFGVAHARASGRDPTLLRADADQALYRSKADGRNRVSTAPRRSQPPPDPGLLPS